MYFEDFESELDWLEPSEFYSGPWTYYCQSVGEDGEKYDVVLEKGLGELRYTTI